MPSPPTGDSPASSPVWHSDVVAHVHIATPTGYTHLQVSTTSVLKYLSLLSVSWAGPDSEELATSIAQINSMPDVRFLHCALQYKLWTILPNTRIGLQ